MQQQWVDLEIIILHEIRDRDIQISYDIPYIWNLKNTDTNELIYKIEIDSDLENEVMVIGRKGQIRSLW